MSSPHRGYRSRWWDLEKRKGSYRDRERPAYRTKRTRQSCHRLRFKWQPRSSRCVHTCSHLLQTVRPIVTYCSRKSLQMSTRAHTCLEAKRSPARPQPRGRAGTGQWGGEGAGRYSRFWSCMHAGKWTTCHCCQHGVSLEARMAFTAWGEVDDTPAARESLGCHASERWVDEFVG